MSVKHSAHKFRPFTGKSSRSALSLDFLICLSVFSCFTVMKNDFKKDYSVKCVPFSLVHLQYHLCLSFWAHTTVRYFRRRLTIFVCTFQPSKSCCRLNEMRICARCQNRTFLSARQKRNSVSYFTESIWGWCQSNDNMPLILRLGWCWATSWNQAIFPHTTRESVINVSDRFRTEALPRIWWTWQPLHCRNSGK